MNKRKKKKNDVYKLKEIQKASGLLLQKTLLDFKNTTSDLLWNDHSREDQNDFGIDFEYELISKDDQQFVFTFKIQNKGSENKLTPLKSTPNKGFISYQINLRNAIDYYYRLNAPLIITICDLENNTVYWHPIQLDDSIPGKIDLAKKGKKGSIQIYTDPNNKLTGENIDRFLNDIKASNSEQYHRAKENLSYPLLTKKENILIDKKNPLLTQFYDAINIYFSEFSLIPSNHLLRLYPFKKDGSGYQYYNCFKAYIDNKEFFDLLKKIEPDGSTKDLELKKIPNHKKYIKCLINTLYSNLIQSVEERKLRLYVKIDAIAPAKTECQCVRCLSYRFLISKALSKIQFSKKDNYDDKFKKAYSNYLAGNFISSAKQFIELKNECGSKRKYVYKFICQFNLLQIGKMLRSYYWDHQDYTQIESQIKKIVLDDELSLLKEKDFFGYDLLSWLNNDKFFYDISSNIHGIVKKIELQYESQLYGGWSNNSYACELLNEMSLLHQFIAFNYIIYDEFPEFRELFDLVIKGLFCSHAINPSQKSRIIFFNDFTIRLIFNYGNATALKTHFSRYKLSHIEYKSENSGVSFFAKLAINLFEDIPRIYNSQDSLDKENFFLSKKYNDLLNNALTLSSFLELSDEDVEAISSSVVKLASKPGTILPGNVESLTLFVSRKGKGFSDATIIALLKCILKPEYHNDDRIVFTIADTIRANFPSVKLQDNQIEELINIYEEKCPACNFSHQKDALVYFHKIASFEGQMLIKERIISLLDKKFETQLFYLAVFFDIITPDKYYDLLIEAAKPTPGIIRYRSIFSGEETKFSILINRVLDIAFKYNFDLQEKKFDVFRGYDSYYDWLFNLESFEYKNFDPVWIQAYPSSEFFSRFSSLAKVKDQILSYLKSKHNPYLERIYIANFAK